MDKNIPASEDEKIILNTVKDELFPVLSELKQLLVEIQELRIKFPLYSKKLNSYNLQYQQIAKRFFTTVQKLETPDILFKDKTNESMEVMVSYFKYQGAFIKNIETGTKYVEIIDRTLDRKNQTVFNSWTVSLAFVAILISVISILPDRIGTVFLKDGHQSSECNR